MKKLDGRSLDIEAANIAKLKELFPAAVEEGRIDFAILRQLLGDYVDDEQERYSFSWNGKGRALHLAQIPSTGTLRPVREDSKDWDTTGNLYIEGDNLEVLKLLQKSYHDKVKMIYIDPPYNTEKDRIYHDDFHDNIANYKRMTGQIDDEGYPLRANSEASGRFHTNWLNMMYPRLVLSRNLLAKDGVILINIDENELDKLKFICDEIFGSKNDLGTIVWDKRNPKGDAKGISCQHENILVFARNKETLTEKCRIQRPKKNAKAMLRKAKRLFSKVGEEYTLEEANKDFSYWLLKQPNLSGGERAYNKIDMNGMLYREVSMSWPNKKQAPPDYFVPLVHPKTGKPCPVPERGWRNPSDTMQELLKHNMIIFGADETTQPRRKYLLEENMYENIPSVIYYGGSDTDMLANLGISFDNAKSISICQEHISAFTEKEDIILDFFSGSATTAHAVMQLNSDDDGKRKFIMVQLPEKCASDTEAFKAGYKNICEIGKERIRRAGEKIKAECKDESAAASLDVGFKVLRLDSSNLREWNTAPEDLQLALENSVDNLLPGRSEEDLVYEIMLKLGLDLTYPIEEHDFAGETIYIVGAGALMIALGRITVALADELIRLHADYENEVWQVVFRDGGFASESDKANAIETLHCAGLADDSIICV